MPSLEDMRGSFGADGTPQSKGKYFTPQDMAASGFAVFSSSSKDTPHISGADVIARHVRQG